MKKSKSFLKPVLWRSAEIITEPVPWGLGQAERIFNEAESDAERLENPIVNCA